MLNTGTLLLKRGRRWSGAVVVGWVLACLLPLAAGATTDSPTIVAIGESNTDAQRANVLDYLGADAADRVVTITVDETLATMDGVFDLSGVDSAYSSTALTCLSAGSGIDVMTRNIEAVPPDLYALVLMTAGMTDVQLAAAAPDDAPALGMTALTGVFKTWDMAPCSSFGGDPERRQLALEELALIAEIGLDRDAIREVTLVVLEAQREVIGGQRGPDEVEEIVAAEVDGAGLDLGEGDQAAIVGFLARLSRADIDWGPFSDGWSTRHAEDGSGVVLIGSGGPEAPARGRTVADRASETSAVGGRTGPIEVSATEVPADEPAPATHVTTPEAASAPRSPLGLPMVSTPVAGDDDSGVAGTISDRGGDVLRRWWPLALGLGGVLLLVVGLRRQPSETSKTWYVSRGRMLWLGRTVRRPAMRPSPRGSRPVVTRVTRGSSSH